MYDARRHTNRNRWTAAVIAVVYLMGFISTFAHDLEEQHVVCPEHGHEIHLSHDGHEHEVEVEEEDDIAKFEAVPSGEHSDHDHCEFTVVTNSPRVLVEAPTLSHPVIGDHQTNPGFVPSAPIRGPTQAIYSYAPKTSPPAIA